MMNQMLKLAILGVAACGVFALTGCGGDKAASSSAASSAAGSMGSMGMVRRIIIWKRHGVLEYMVFTKDGKFKSRNE